MTPRQFIADDLTRLITQVQNPNGTDAWSERLEARTWELFACRVDAQLARMEAALLAAGIKPETLT